MGSSPIASTNRPMRFDAFYREACDEVDAHDMVGPGAPLRTPPA